MLTPYATVMPPSSSTALTSGGDPNMQRMMEYDPYMRMIPQSHARVISTMPALRSYAPILCADLVESPTDYHVHCDLPGVLPGDVDITMTEGNLTIRAHRREVHEFDTNLVHRTERNLGKVERSFVLPPNLDLDRATANFDKGVLCISLPKKEGFTGTRKITVL